MDNAIAAKYMETLGHEHRMAIYRLLVKAGYDGAIVGTIQKAVGIPASTLSHHIAWLVRAGLVTQERRGRELICRADFALMHDLVNFMIAECCDGDGFEACAPNNSRDAA